jgi:hypothetical protein
MVEVVHKRRGGNTTKKPLLDLTKKPAADLAQKAFAPKPAKVGGDTLPRRAQPARSAHNKGYERARVTKSSQRSMISLRFSSKSDR